MNESTAVHGFPDRVAHRRALRELYVRIGLKTTCPILLALYIDATGGPLLLVPVVALFPLEGLRFQFLIWRRYLRVFGMPPLSDCRQMIQLDAIRTFNPRGHAAHNVSRAGAIQWSLGFSGLATGFYAWSWFSALVTPLYFGSFFLVIAVKVMIRRCRPPAVLLLGSSSVRSSTLQMKVQETVTPLLVTTCLQYDSSSELWQQTFDFLSYRTSDDHWRRVVTSLIQLSPLVVIDVRAMTEAIEFEVQLALKAVERNRLFFVVDSESSQALPSDRCFNVGTLIETLDEQLGSPCKKAPARKVKAFRDRQNGYFTFRPPAAWRLIRVKDPRTKVRFLHPAAPHVELMIVVRESVAENYASMLQSDRAAAHQFNALGAACTVVETTLLGLPASEASVVLPEGEGFQVIRKFMAEGLQFTISYSAPTRRLFDRYADEVQQSVNSIEVLRGERSPAKVREQCVANRVRLGETLASWKADEAVKVLQEAAAAFPDSEDIHRTLEDLRRRHHTPHGT
jgi:hypothetical protein